MDRESTRLDWCSFWKVCKSSEVNSPLPDLHHLPLALALVVVLVGVLSWIRPLGSRAILGKVISTAAVIAPIVAISTIELWGIRPWAKLLLLRHWRSESSLLLRRPKDKPAHWGISLWRSGWSVLHQTIPRWLSTRGSCWCLPLLLSTMGSNTVFLSNGQVDQLIVGVGLNKVQAFLELGIKASTKTIALLGVCICMMARILAQLIEGLCILKNSAGSLI